MRVIVLIALAILGLDIAVHPASAQSWTSPRGRPPLWQIIALDRSGDTSWLYGAEDIAGDGASKFEADEAAADLTSVYADADRDRVWIRAYVAGTNPIPAELITFFFIDTDADARTGAHADAKELWAEFKTDPSSGGYERAIGVRGNGQLIGAYRWDAAQKRWTMLMPETDAIQIEIDRDQDPLPLSGKEHAYVQVAARHAISGLDAACKGSIFVRTWLDDPPQRSFGDDVAAAASCRPQLNPDGDPVILHAESCDADKDCPASARCREHVCVFEFACGADGDCRTGERCLSSKCVKVVTGACDDAADCEGLVCDASKCVACAESGSKACASGYACTPRGTCVDPDRVAMSGGETGGRGGADGGGGGSGAKDDDEYPDGKVRGGSFHCAAGSGESGSGWLWLVPLLALVFWRRARWS
ncbi:MAG TPA: hypothetical protein VJR89_14475 [Polyangiales bacterium]|nr:hypothetical protein [Polyangiales bacterium]